MTAPIREHLIEEHGYVPEALEGMGHNDLVETHDKQPQPHRHVQELEARTAQIAATSEAAYEAACDRFNTVSTTYATRRQALLDQLAALSQEFDEASAELHKHEDCGGIPLYSRCAICTPGRALPAGHAGGHR